MLELAGIGRCQTFGHGPPVVILSNPQADPGWWARPLITALTGAGYQAVTFVHTGSGHTPAEVARDVGRLLDQLPTGPVRLLGWSQGAAIAQEVALLRPGRVAAAVLIATYGRQNTMDRVLQDAWQQLDSAGEDLDPVRLALLLLSGYPPADLGDDAFLDPLLPGLRHWAATTDATAEGRHRSRAFVRGYQERLKDLAGIRAPCLVMGFAQDADTFVTRAREVAAAIPGSRYVELPAAGHLTPILEPDRVIGPVLQFLTEIDDPGEASP